jgi:hypothetical protein
MLTNSRYLNGSPTRCAFCNQPFHLRNGYFESWRAPSGEHFCSEFCADDAEEAHFQKLHAITFSVATHSTRF